MNKIKCAIAIILETIEELGGNVSGQTFPPNMRGLIDALRALEATINGGLGAVGGTTPPPAVNNKLWFDERQGRLMIARGGQWYQTNGAEGLIHVGETQPPITRQGQPWFDTRQGKHFVYVDRGDPNLNGYYQTNGNEGFLGDYDAVESQLLYLYSLRRGLSSYSGPLIRVRRSSDFTDRDFYPDGQGHLDINEVETWVGAGNTGFVVIWYDQLESNNLVNSGGAEPYIINAGTTSLLDNGRPAVDFYEDRSLQTASSTGDAGRWMATVFKQSIAGSTWDGFHSLFDGTIGTTTERIGATLEKANTGLVSFIYPSSLFIDGTQYTPSTSLPAMLPLDQTKYTVHEFDRNWVGYDPITTAFVGNTANNGSQTFDNGCARQGEIAVFSSNLTTSTRLIVEASIKEYFVD